MSKHHDDPDNDIRVPLEEVTAAMLKLLDPNPLIAETRLRELLSDLTRSFEWHGSGDAENIASEAIYRGFKKVQAGADLTEAGFRGYVWGIAKNVARESARRERREQPVSQEEIAARVSHTREHAEADTRLMLARVKPLIDALPSNDRRVFLRYCTEDEHGAHAKELGITSAYLRVKVHRIREQLRRWALPERERDTHRVRKKHEAG